MLNQPPITVNEAPKKYEAVNSLLMKGVQEDSERKVYEEIEFYVFRDLIRLWPEIRGIEVQPQRAAPSESSGNCFEDKGRAFRIRFEGVDCDLPDLKGVKILHKLISKQGVEIPLQELDPLPVLEMPVEDRQSGKESDHRGRKPMTTIPEVDLVDAEAMDSVRNKLKAMRCELEDAKALGNVEEQADIEKEMKPLLDYMGSVTNLSGRPRKCSSEITKQIKAIQKSIRDVYTALQKKNAPLEKHLRESIRIGEKSCYRPRGQVEWHT